MVLDLLVEGLSNKLVADRLNISEHTAKFHIANALAKLGTGSRTIAAVRWALHRADAPKTHCDRCTRLVEIATRIVETTREPATT